MQIIIRKIGNSVGAIIPRKLAPKIGTHYKITKIGTSFVLTPIKSDIFAHPDAWIGFRNSISEDDKQWDKVD